MSPRNAEPGATGVVSGLIKKATPAAASAEDGDVQYVADGDVSMFLNVMMSCSAADKAFLASLSEKDLEAELKHRKRIDDAIKWVDKEIRKLIAEIVKLGGNAGMYEYVSRARYRNERLVDTTVTFGELFGATVQVFEALSGKQVYSGTHPRIFILGEISGTLMTAKKRGVVAYDGQLLLQRVHDDVEIALLKMEIEDSPLPDHAKV